MRLLTLLSLFCLTGCSGAVRVKDTTPVGDVPPTHNTDNPMVASLPSSGIWILWVLAILVLGTVTYQMFRKETKEV
tara:strand:- start:45 stop:272 length:228 start_codon:yes stop_codon:yes gene_type:complete